MKIREGKRGDSEDKVGSVHAIKSYGGVDFQPHSFLTRTNWEWSLSRPCCLSRRVKRPVVPIK